jgi:autotransporter passenger strand-loop-strand repeat protein
VSGGGVDFVFGYAVSTVVSSGGALGLFGSASGMTLSSGAYACVEAGGTATSTSVDGILGVVGSSLNATVSYGGEITVHGGASGTTADSGGFEYVADGGTESGATISGGALEVGSGGTLDSAAFASSGALGGFLLLDDSTQFHGLVAGFGSGADIALLDIGYASGITTFAWSQTTGGLNGSGTLAVTDGTHNANIILLGNYVAGRFALDSYNGGTLVTDPPLQASPAMLAHA